MDNIFQDIAGKLRVLIVDDNPDSAESLAVLLNFNGHKTQMAYDGIEAFDLAQEFCPDVMLLDIGLPKMNGLDVARKIRKEDWGQGIKLFAITGWGQDDDKEQSRDAGFDYHFVKPIDAIALINTLEQFTSAQP